MPIPQSIQDAIDTQPTQGP